MKSLLLASSALLLTMGAASAEGVSLSGSARMGLIQDFGSDDTLLTSRVRVQFTMSGETDTGLSFGASVRNDQSGQGNTENGDSVVYISGAFGKLSMGDVDGAAAAAVGQVDGVGLTGLSDLNEMAYLATGGSSADFLDKSFFIANPPSVDITSKTAFLYEYSTGDLSVYASATQLQHTFAEPCCTWDASPALSLGAAYTMNNYRFALGYEVWKAERNLVATSAKVDNLALGVDGTFGDVTVKARYSTGGSSFAGSDYQDHEQVALSATYTAGDVSFTGFASRMEFTSAVGGANITTTDAIGLGASYDLGGGASLVGGVVRKAETIFAGPKETDTAFDMGLSFSF